MKNIFNNKLGLLAAMAVAFPSVMCAQEQVEVILVASKDIQLRINNASQNPYGASLELRENTGGDTGDNGVAIRDYGFCGLMGFNLSEIYDRISDGYKMVDVQLTLTNANNSGKTILLKPFSNDWEEVRETTYALMESQIMAAANEESILSMSLPSIGGKKPFELQDKLAVEHYDITGYQRTVSDDNLLNYVAKAVTDRQSGLSFLLTGDDNASANGAICFTKDASKANNGTGTTDEYKWNGSAWVKTGNSISRYDAMLNYFGLSEEQFMTAVAPKITVTMQKTGVNVATSLPVNTELTLANTIRNTQATCQFDDNQGNRSEDRYYCSNNNGDILYLGRYDLKRLRKIVANVAFDQCEDNYVALNFAAMDAHDDDITADYVSTNSGTIRDGKNNILSIRGIQTISSEDGSSIALWNNAFKIGANYEVDIQAKTISVDNKAYAEYWKELGTAKATTYSVKRKDGSTSESSFNNRFDGAISSDNLQDLYIYATAGKGRLGVYSITFYFTDNSAVTVPVTAMNGYEITPQNLSADLILSSSELDGTPITSVKLGETSMSAETVSMLNKLQQNGISVNAAQVDYQMTVGDAKAATLVLPYEAELPSGVKAYTLTYTSGNEAQANEVDRIAPNQPVLINAEPGEYSFEAKDVELLLSDQPMAETLVGTYESVQVPAGAFVLQHKQDEGVAFYKVNNNSVIDIAPFRAYLQVPSVELNKLLINFGDVTGVAKLLNDEIYAGPVYNLQGIKVADSASEIVGLPQGIYLVNGKKFIVK